MEAKITGTTSFSPNSLPYAPVEEPPHQRKLDPNEQRKFFVVIESFFSFLDRYQKALDTKQGVILTNREKTEETDKLRDKYNKLKPKIKQYLQNYHHGLFNLNVLLQIKRDEIEKCWSPNGGYLSFLSSNFGITYRLSEIEKALERRTNTLNPIIKHLMEEQEFIKIGGEESRGEGKQIRGPSKKSERDTESQKTMSPLYLELNREIVDEIKEFHVNWFSAIRAVQTCEKLAEELTALEMINSTIETNNSFVAHYQVKQYENAKAQILRINTLWVHRKDRAYGIEHSWEKALLEKLYSSYEIRRAEIEERMRKIEDKIERTSLLKEAKSATCEEKERYAQAFESLAEESEVKLSAIRIIYLLRNMAQFKEMLAVDEAFEVQLNEEQRFGLYKLRLKEYHNLKDSINILDQYVEGNFEKVHLRTYLCGMINAQIQFNQHWLERISAIKHKFREKTHLIKSKSENGETERPGIKDQKTPASPKKKLILGWW